METNTLLNMMQHQNIMLTILMDATTRTTQSMSAQVLFMNFYYDDPVYLSLFSDGFGFFLK